MANPVSLKKDYPALSDMVHDIRQCRVCADVLPHEPRPVLQVSTSARIGIFGQAPGTRVHKSGRPFTDPSGDRLRDWMQVDEGTFYDERLIAIVPMGFCFPGLDAKGGDLPPRRECADTWRQPLIEKLNNLDLILLVGAYAQRWHLPRWVKANPDADKVPKTVTQTVEEWRRFGPLYMPLPHPSWRNTGWMKRNPWFETDLLPELRERIAQILNT